MSATRSEARRATLHRRVRLIVAFTISYNVIEATSSPLSRCSRTPPGKTSNRCADPR